MKLIVLLLNLISLSAIAQDYPSCDISKEARFSLFDESTVETVKITIKGVPCYKAQLALSILNSSGEEIYNYSAPFKEHTAIHWEAQDMEKIAEDLASYFVSSKLVSGCNKLALPDNWAEYQEYVVSKEQYAKYKSSACKTYNHPSHYEARTEVVFIQETGKAVVVGKYGL